jgi:hypothetical protein
MLDKDPSARPTLLEVSGVLASVRDAKLRRTSKQLAILAPRARSVLPFAAVAAGALALGGAIAFRVIERRTPPAVIQAPVVVAEPEKAAPKEVAPPAPAAPVLPTVLVVRVEAPGAQLTVDGKPARIEEGVARITAIAPGRHHVVVRAPGWHTVRRDVSLEKGATEELPIQMKPAAEAKGKRPASGDYTLDPFAD